MKKDNIFFKITFLKHLAKNDINDKTVMIRNRELVKIDNNCLINKL
jgi:hypothetical protein